MTFVLVPLLHVGVGRTLLSLRQCEFPHDDARGAGSIHAPAHQHPPDRPILTAIGAVGLLRKSLVGNNSWLHLTTSCYYYLALVKSRSDKWPLSTGETPSLQHAYLFSEMKSVGPSLEHASTLRVRRSYGRRNPGRPHHFVGVGRTERCIAEGRDCGNSSTAGANTWVLDPKRPLPETRTRQMCREYHRAQAFAGAGIKPGHRSVVPSPQLGREGTVQIDEGLASLAKRQVKKLTSALAGQGDEAGA